MLGRDVADPQGVEGPAGADPGLGLLDVSTVMTASKRLTTVAAVHAASGTAFSAMKSISAGPRGLIATGLLPCGRRPEGAISRDGRYLHGMFRDDAFRAAFLSGLGATV